MASALKPTPPSALPAETAPGYSRADSLLFQSWLVLFLMVICFALVNYLISYIPRFGK